MLTLQDGLERVVPSADQSNAETTTAALRLAFANIPRPLINSEKKLIVLWSPKSACTTTYVWFSKVSGFLDEVRSYDPWPHRHRMEVFYLSSPYTAAMDSDLSEYRALRVIRDPLSRAASMFRFALHSRAADDAIEQWSSNRLGFEKGISFQQFLDFLASRDMRSCNPHFRPQFHACEKMLDNRTIINISRQNLFEELNRFEAQSGWPKTDFTSMEWLHALEGPRMARQSIRHTGVADEMPIARNSKWSGKNFPSYGQLLTNAARDKIHSTYAIDFETYRDFL